MLYAEFMTSIIDLDGGTPLVEVTRLDTGPCRLFLKLKARDPSGSIMDSARARDDRGGGI